jgi:hypothetical protein
MLLQQKSGRPQTQNQNTKAQKTELSIMPWGIKFDIHSPNEQIRNASRCAMRTYARQMEVLDKKLSERILCDIAEFDRSELEERRKGASVAQKDFAQGVREGILFMLYNQPLSFKSLSTTLRHLRQYSTANDEYVRSILFKLKEEKLVKFNVEDGVWELDQCTFML